MSSFFNCFRTMLSQESDKNKPKGYKVTNVDRTRRFGIACKNFEELKRKACAKFNISDEEQKGVKIYLTDGSEIDGEYFLTVKPQTTFILQRPGENLLSDADRLYNILRQVNMEFITTGDAVSKFLSENLKGKILLLNKALNKDDTKTFLSSREDHPDWFKHLETTLDTKEAYMHRRCQDRIRCYLYKTIDQIKNSEVYLKNEIARRNLTNVITFFKLQLKEDHCMGFYFDRSYAKKLLNKNNQVDEKNIETSDETDNIFLCNYDHCPCKIKIGSMLYNNENILTKLFIDESEISELISIDKDELDARKISPKKKSKIEDGHTSDDLSCPYEVSRIEAEVKFALCDHKGEFKCDGIWNSDRCKYGERHSINPYRSYEELVLFSTWNFDHRIERSRTLIPNLIKISERDAVKQKDVRYFYDNIFTTKNLRLVHIICHDKGAHK